MAPGLKKSSPSNRGLKKRAAGFEWKKQQVGSPINNKKRHKMNKDSKQCADKTLLNVLPSLRSGDDPKDSNAPPPALLSSSSSPPLFLLPPLYTRSLTQSMPPVPSPLPRVDPVSPPVLQLLACTATRPAGAPALNTHAPEAASLPSCPTPTRVQAEEKKRLSCTTVVRPFAGAADDGPRNKMPLSLNHSAISFAPTVNQCLPLPGALPMLMLSSFSSPLAPAAPSPPWPAEPGLPAEPALAAPAAVPASVTVPAVAVLSSSSSSSSSSCSAPPPRGLNSSNSAAAACYAQQRADTVALIGCVLTKAFMNANSVLPEDGCSITCFHSSSVPSSPIGEYFKGLAARIDCSAESCVLCLVLLQRVAETRPAQCIDRLTIHRLVLTCLMVSAKFFDDHVSFNRVWADVGGLSVQELNRMEREFLRLVEHSLFVNPSSYSEAYNMLYTNHLHVQCGPECKQATERCIRLTNNGDGDGDGGEG